jgi:molybdopterin-guanine dinucleotide biosynthesis protein A
MNYNFEENEAHNGRTRTSVMRLDPIAEKPSNGKSRCRGCRQPPVRDISACIIAGGQSSRFGADKAVFNHRGKPLIRHVIDSLSPVFERISLIADQSDKFAFLGLPCRSDIKRGIGPLGGLHAALVHSETELTFIVACDMPDLCEDLIRYMVSVSSGFDATVPLLAGGHEPLHAIYAKSCIGPIERGIAEGRTRVTGFFDDVSVKMVHEDEIRKFADPESAFRNINFPHQTLY